MLCDKCYSHIEFSNNATLLDQSLTIQACTRFGEVSSSIVHTLKYDSVKDLGVVCARIMYMSCLFPEVDIITAVPLHKKRQDQRGFNQAEVIATELSRLLNLQYLPLLLRQKETINFAKVTKKDTRARLSSSLFAINPSFQRLVQNKSILIVDDVWTTGATITSCAKVLLNQKAIKVSGLVFTHGL